MSEPDINNTTVITTENAGKGLAASTLIPAGSVIIKISNPYLILLEKAHLQSTCSWCFTTPESSTLKGCGGCKVVRYCSPECQKNDWQAIHKKECKILKGLHDVPPTATRGLMQMFLRHKYGNNPDPRWEGLVTNNAQLAKDQHRFNGLTLQATAAARYSGRGDSWVYLGTMVLCQMSMNSFRVTMPDDTPIGLCFEPILALANHSCLPNAVVVFDGRAVSFRSLVEIQKGDEIFISYIDPMQTRDKRQKELEHRYFFTCNCIKCSEDQVAYQVFTFFRLQYPDLNTPTRRIDALLDPQSLSDTANSALAAYQQLYRHPMLGMMFNTAQNRLDSCLDLPNDLPSVDQLSLLQNLCAGKSFGVPAIAPYPAILHSIFLIYLQMEAWFPALICLLSLVLHSDPFNYLVNHHPIRVMNLYSVAKLFKHLATLSPAEFSASVAVLDSDVAMAVRDMIPLINFLDILQIVLSIVSEEVGRSHGEGSRFAKEVEAEVEDINMGRRMAGRSEGDILGRWKANEGDEETTKAVRSAMQVMWKLAGCVGSLLARQL